MVAPIADQLTGLHKRWEIESRPWLGGFILWLGWTGCTWLAFLASLLVIEVGERSDLSGLDGLLGGAIIGLGQWVVIRPYIHRAYRWIGVSALTWGLLAGLHIGAIAWIVPGTTHLLMRGIFGLLYGSYVGLILGIGQWWTMRRQISQAWRWIPLSTGVWAVAIALGWILGGLLRTTSNLFVSEVVGLMVAWGAIATLSGIALVGLLYPKPPSSSHQAHPTRPARRSRSIPTADTDC